jgi:hypothetical protein
LKVLLGRDSLLSRHSQILAINIDLFDVYLLDFDDFVYFDSVVRVQLDSFDLVSDFWNVFAFLLCTYGSLVKVVFLEDQLLLERHLMLGLRTCHHGKDFDHFIFNLKEPLWVDIGNEFRHIEVFVKVLAQFKHLQKVVLRRRNQENQMANLIFLVVATAFVLEELISDPAKVICRSELILDSAEESNREALDLVEIKNGRFLLVIKAEVVFNAKVVHLVILRDYHLPEMVDTSKRGASWKVAHVSV